MQEKKARAMKERNFSPSGSLFLLTLRWFLLTRTKDPNDELYCSAASVKISVSDLIELDNRGLSGRYSAVFAANQRITKWKLKFGRIW